MTATSSILFSSSSGGTNLVKILQQRAVQQPDQLAFTFLRDGENLEVNMTFGELDRQARAIGAMLQKNIKAGDRVLLLYPPGLDFITALFGCLYAGAIAVPVYPPEPSRLFETLPRLLAPAKDAQPKIALTTQKILSIAYLLFKLAPHLKSLRWLATNNVPKGTEDSWQEPVLTSDSIAFLIYTSGSTGDPKGVMLTYGNLLYQMKLVALQEDVKPYEKGVSWVPPYHISGLFIGIFMPIYLGIQNILISPLHFLQKPSRWLRAVSRYRAFTSGAPNFAYDLCTRQITPQEKETLDLSCWRHAITGSELIRPETLDHFVKTFAPCGFQRKSFLGVYGLTESTMITSFGQVNTPPVIDTIKTECLEENRIVRTGSQDQGARAIVGCGKAIGDTKIIIAQPDSLTKCLPDQVGEIWISGPIVAQGYWNRPDETQKTFGGYLADTKEGPFLRTGDLGYLHNEELFITGRLKEMIIIRGINYYPEDIEQTVEQSHPILRPACGAAFSIEIDGEERLVIVQEVEHLKKQKVDEVMEKIREAVSKYHNLQVYAIALIKAESIQRTVTKKIQRYACKKAFLEGGLKIVAAWQRGEISKEKKTELTVKSSHPKTAKEIEPWFFSKISEKLGIDPGEIDTEKPLTSYGLDSLSAVRLVTEIEEELGVTILIATLFESPTIRQILKELENQFSTKKRPGKSEKTKLDLNAETILDPRISFAPSTNKLSEESKSIFFTGATGFLGSFLLHELLHNTSAKVYCLARAANENQAKHRIQKNLQFFSLWNDYLSERIIPVNGDLSKTLFGLSTGKFEWFAENIDVIYHVGAIVNFIFSYRDLEAPNVLGTQEIIRLAGKFKLKPVHYISTISVFPIAGHPEGKILFEDDSLAYTEGLLNGYAQSKWVAEKLIMASRLKGLPTAIYRVGEVIGHSVTGISKPTNDAYSNFIKGGILLGSSPNIEQNLYLVPVDYVSKSIFHLSCERSSLGKNFHIISNPIEGSQVLNIITSLGYPLRRVSYPEWLQEADQLAQSFPQNPLAALMPFLKSQTMIGLGDGKRLLKLDHRNTLEGLKGSTISCPPQTQLMKTYLSYLKQSGFLNTPLEDLA